VHHYFIPHTFRQKVLTRLLIDLFTSRKATAYEKTQSHESKGQSWMDESNSANAEQHTNLLREAFRQESEEKDN